MSLPMMVAIAVCPALLGSQEGIRTSQSKSSREQHRARRCNLVVSCVQSSRASEEIDGMLVVLKDSKLCIRTNSFPSSHTSSTAAASTTEQPSISALEDHDERHPADHTSPLGYPFAGYFLPYPDTSPPYEGLVSTISEDPPFLNWIYLDRDTYEVKYGLRAQAQGHITGPFDCTRQDRRLTLEGWEGFVAVREDEEEGPAGKEGRGGWTIYFDCDDDGLVSKVPPGTCVLEIELLRREKKERRPAVAQTPQTELPRPQTASEVQPLNPENPDSRAHEQEAKTTSATPASPGRQQYEEQGRQQRQGIEEPMIHRGEDDVVEDDAPQPFLSIPIPLISGIPQAQGRHTDTPTTATLPNQETTQKPNTEEDREPYVRQGRITMNGDLSYYTESGPKSKTSPPPGLYPPQAAEEQDSPKHEDSSSSSSPGGDGQRQAAACKPVAAAKSDSPKPDEPDNPDATTTTTISTAVPHFPTPRDSLPGNVDVDLANLKITTRRHPSPSAGQSWRSGVTGKTNNGEGDGDGSSHDLS